MKLDTVIGCAATFLSSYALIAGAADAALAIFTFALGALMVYAATSKGGV